MAQLIVGLSHHPQNGKEQVQNVQIKSNGSPNVLIIGEALDEVVGVINYVACENYSTHSTINGNRC